MPDDPLSQLLAQPIPQMNKVVAPELSDLSNQRIEDALHKPKSNYFRLPYMTYEEIANKDDMYDITDFKTVGNLIRNNIVGAIEKRFPIVGDKYTLKVENIHYEKPKQTSVAEEKDVLLHEKSLSDRLKGTWVLYDNETGEEVQRKNATLLNVPRMTSRGTFIRNGSELGLKHMFRLRPGIYTRIKNNGIVAAHVNPAQTTGRQMSIEMDPETGNMSITRGTRTYGVLPLLRVAGMSDEEIQRAWGKELFDTNNKKYGALTNAGTKSLEEYTKLWNDDILPIKLDAETTETTLGHPYPDMKPEAILKATQNILKVSKSMDLNDTDDRDSLQFQRIVGPADYIPERIVRDGGGLLRNLFNQVTRSGNLDPIVTGAFQPQVDSVFLEDKHAGYIDGSSPVEAFDFASSVSRIGEGGIGSVDAAPTETRGVNDSYAGFVDPIRCYAKDTEVMTSRGWKQISDIAEEDDVICLNNGKVEFSKYTEKHEYDYSDVMYIYKDDTISFAVTHNHRMYVKRNGEDSFTILSAESLFDKLEDNKYYVLLSEDTQNELHELNKNNFIKLPLTPDAPIKVYCLTIKGGLLFTRRNGSKGFWCGNSPESLKVGLDVFLSYGVKKDSSGRLYNKFKDKNGKSGFVDMGTTAKSIVATPEFYNPKADPNEFIPAFYKGKGIEYVRRKDVDYYIDNSNNMMSVGAGMIPLIGGIRSNRTLMGCLHPDTELFIYSHGEYRRVAAKQYLNEFCEGDMVIGLNEKNNKITYEVIREVRKVTENLKCYIVDTGSAKVAVNSIHKWYVQHSDGTFGIVTTEELKTEAESDNCDWIPQLANTPEDIVTSKTVSWHAIKSVVPLEKEPKFLVDLDVDDHVYLLANGMFTHNSKYANQAVSLQNRQAPLVQRSLTLEDGTRTTTEKYLGSQLGARRSPMDGKVISVDDNEIVIQGDDGQKETIGLYHNYPANQKGFLDNSVVVKPGDVVKKDQLIAKSNYTDDEGTAALGTNLKIAFLSADNGGTFEDGITISEDAAKKLASEQLYKVRGDVSPDIEYNKTRYLSLFKNEFTKEQLDKLEDNGLPKPGAVFNTGDPVYLGVQTRDIGVHGVSKNAAAPYVHTWQHDAPGTVTDVVKGAKHFTVYTKAVTPMQVGDKMCFDPETEVLTDSGWISVAKLQAENKVLTMDIGTGDTWFTTFAEYYEFNHYGKMYKFVNKEVDMFVTDNHRIPVSCSRSADYLCLKEAKDIFGKTLFFLVGSDLSSEYSFSCTKQEGAIEEWVPYRGKVYCVNIPMTHTVYVRRNGKAYWSGNSARYGSKGVIAQILPTEQMPTDAEGVPFDVLQSPLGLPSRLNTAQLVETQLGKIAMKTGTKYELPDFLSEDDNCIDFTNRELAKYGMSPTEDIYNPVTGKKIPGIETGVMFYYKLKHMSELKERGRSTGTYSSEDVPLKGEGAARRFGAMEASAVYSGGGEEVLRDAKILRGQRNDEFWRDFRDGKYPELPGIPLVHKKLFAHLQAAGIHLEDRADTVHIYGATDQNMKELTGNRKVTQGATFNSNNMQPIDGGLFDPSIFGAEGDQWGYIELPEPVLNPLMFKTMGSLLGWKDKELRSYLEGSSNLKQRYGTDSLMKVVDSIDLKKELYAAKQTIKAKDTTLAQRDLARKRIRAIEPMLREGKKPSDFFLTRMPVLPPKFRVVAAMGNGTNVAADANFLYKRLMDATDDMKAAKNGLPEEFQLDARKSLYNAVEAVTGLGPTDDPKLEAKGISGVLRWAFGKSSPKLSSLHRKVFGANLDLGSLSTITPDNSLTIDQVGIPERSAWKMFEPFVVRRLTQNGYSMTEALRQVTEQSPEARRELLNVMKDRPILVNRAPTLWRYGIMASMPVLVKDNTIHVNPQICKVYNADFDGDSLLDFIEIYGKPETFYKAHLNNIKNELYYSIDQKNMEESMLNDTNVGLIGKIVTGIENIPVKKETEKKIKDNVTEWSVDGDFYIASLNKETGKVERGKIEKISKHENLQLFDVCMTSRAAFKKVLTCSEDNTLITYDEIGNLVITPTVGAAGRCVPYLHSLNCCTSLADVTRYINLGKQVPLSYDLGVFFGLMIGDGWVDAENHAYIAAECEEIQKEVIRLYNNLDLPKAGGSHTTEYDTTRFGKNKAHKIYLGLAKDTKAIIKYYIGSGAYNKQIPLPSLTASEAHLIGILVGLIASDGSINYSKAASGKKAASKSILFHTTSTGLRDGVRYICRRLGIKTSVSPYKGKVSKQTCYAISLCLHDVVNLYNRNSKFRMIANSDQIALEKIVSDINAAKINEFDIVPFPKHLRTAMSVANIGGVRSTGLIVMAKTDISRYMNKGWMSRDIAKQIVAEFRNTDWSTYRENGNIKAVIHYTQDTIVAAVEAWCNLVENTDIEWGCIESITKRDGLETAWDITVPGTLTFATADGVFVQDSMTTHVPVSEQAVAAMKKNMLPSKLLLSPRNYKAHFIPRSEMAQGLYLASRVDKTQPSRYFKTEEEMLQALKRGEIKVDTPVKIG